VPIGKSNDAVVFDAGRRLAFASNGDGTLTIIGLDKGGNIRQDVPFSDRQCERSAHLGLVTQSLQPPTEPGPFPSLSVRRSRVADHLAAA
jgi:hypothetical protein